APAEAFRIQISATSRFVPTDGRYEAVRSIGDLRSEAIPGRTDLVRVTVGYFTDPAEAKTTLRQVQTSGFDTAFIVRYDKGVRYGKVRL
ncbi:MAG: SPOR domain-containing protein, partial [Bacteroidota bacterium]